MAIDVIETACTLDQAYGKGMVVIGSNLGGPPFHAAFDELTEGMAARELAVQYGSSQLHAAVAVNGNTEGPYPVNKHGVPTDQVRGPGGEELPQSHPDKQPHRYWIGVPIIRKI